MPGTRSADILQQLANDADASNFLEMVKSTGLNETLNSSGPFTIFAPINAAFTKLPAHLVANVTSNQGLLAQVLENHMVFGQKLAIEDLQEEDLVLENIAGFPLRVNRYRKSKFYRVIMKLKSQICDRKKTKESTDLLIFCGHFSFYDLL